MGRGDTMEFWEKGDREKKEIVGWVDLGLSGFDEV